MATCGNCARAEFFLKLQRGLCPSCLATITNRIEEATRQLGKEVRRLRSVRLIETKLDSYEKLLAVAQEFVAYERFGVIFRVELEEGFVSRNVTDAMSALMKLRDGAARSALADNYRELTIALAAALTPRRRLELARRATERARAIAGRFADPQVLSIALSAFEKTLELAEREYAGAGPGEEQSETVLPAEASSQCHFCGRTSAGMTCLECGASLSPQEVNTPAPTEVPQPLSPPAAQALPEPPVAGSGCMTVLLVLLPLLLGVVYGITRC
jgi:hypothetical protein